MESKNKYLQVKIYITDLWTEYIPLTENTK